MKRAGTSMRGPPIDRGKRQLTASSSDAVLWSLCAQFYNCTRRAVKSSHEGDRPTAMVLTLVT